MGYPVITRLGVSQFWYKHWYSDVCYSNKLKLSKLLLDLLKFYLNYGLTTSNNIFFNKFFFNLSKIPTKYKIIDKNLKFYRRFFYTNKTLNIEHSYLLRIKTNKYFPLRTWLVKYDKWLILCFSCYKPIKKAPTKKSLIKKEVNSTSINFTYVNSSPLLNRFKLVYTYALSKLFKNCVYCF